jgi:cytoskeletal protein CcmA (bactofilin family)
MALWKETGSTPSPTASGTSAAPSSTTVTELHGKAADRAPSEATTVTGDTSSRRAPLRVPGAESVIAAELAIEGKIVGGGDVRIAGRFKGDVQVDGNFRIDPGARLEGQVRAGVVVVGGELQGNIDAAKQVDVLATGVIVGDVKAASITVAAGSRMRGHVEFGWDEKEKHGTVELKGSSPRSV